MWSQEAHELYTRATVAIRTEGRGSALRVLSQAAMANPRDENAWLLLSTIVDDREKQRYCLDRVLAINPRCPAARHRVEWLKGVSDELTRS